MNRITEQIIILPESRASKTSVSRGEPGRQRPRTQSSPSIVPAKHPYDLEIQRPEEKVGPLIVRRVAKPGKKDRSNTSIELDALGYTDELLNEEWDHFDDADILNFCCGHGS